MWVQQGEVPLQMAECWETAASWPSRSGSDTEVCALYCTRWPLGSQQIHLAPVVKNPESAAKPLGAVAVSTSSKFWDLGQVPLVCLCLSFPSCKMGTITIVAPSDSWEWAHPHEARERQPSVHTRVQRMCLSAVTSSLLALNLDQMRFFNKQLKSAQLDPLGGIVSFVISLLLYQNFWTLVVKTL